MQTDISYLLYWDDDTIPINGNMTFGNHLDNDIVVPGEDVADFHARVDLSERGPVVIPLGDATVSVNGQERASPVQLIIGDTVGIGQEMLQVGIEVEARDPDAAQSWILRGDDDSRYEIRGELSIGRATSADISIPKEHISRHHARLLEHDQMIWIQDLNSANGTRLNNTPVIGGARMFHGDYIYFDKVRYQLIGQGGALTPVQHFVDPLRGTRNQPPPKQLDTTEFTAVEEPLLAPVGVPALGETGAFLLGVSESVDGKVLRLGIGESLLGRADHCHITIADSTVSQEHAKISVRPEGVRVTNLMSTNGTKVNGADVTSAELVDGDVLRVGRVSLVFKDIPASRVEEHPILKHLSAWLVGAVVVVSALLAITLIF